MVKLTRAERFKDARTVHNQHGKQTMDSVAAATGITKSVIHALENDKKERDVGYKTVALLAKHYGVSADWLMELSEDHQRIPSAVDDLGISDTAVNQIMSISSNKYADDMLESLSMILEDPQLFTLLIRVKMVSDAVKTEIAYLQNKVQEVDANDQYSFGLLEILMDDQITSGEIERDIIAAHPELANRVIIDCGQDALERRIEDLENSFSSLVKHAAGYDYLNKLLMGGQL